LEAGDHVLGHGQVGHAPQADVAVGPGLGAGPLDRVVVVLGLLHAERRLLAGAATDPAAVDPDADVTFRHPGRGVDALVVLILQPVGVAGAEAVLEDLLLLGLDLIADAVMVEGLAVEALVQDDRVVALGGRSEDIAVDE
jgi:hypothetical protein